MGGAGRESRLRDGMYQAGSKLLHPLSGPKSGNVGRLEKQQWLGG